MRSRIAAEEQAKLAREINGLRVDRRGRIGPPHTSRWLAAVGAATPLWAVTTMATRFGSLA